MRALLQPLFLENFSSTSLIAEAEDHTLAGFLVGFPSADDARVAYIHFAGVAPDARGHGLGRELYRRFEHQMAERGVRSLRCVTSIVNEPSVAFHRALGFDVTGRKSNDDVDGGEYVHMERAVEPRPSPEARRSTWPPRPTAVLTGRFVELRPTTKEDGGELFAALNDERVWRHLTKPQPTSVADMTAIVDDLLASMFPWTVRLTRPIGGVPQGSVVGWSTYLDWSTHHARIEIGNTTYAREVWGSVVNPEAKLLLLGYAFDGLSFGRVQLKTDVRNERSQDAIARLGAVREGVLRHFQRRADGTIRNSVLYSITSDQWPDVRAGLEARVASYPGFA